MLFPVLPWLFAGPVGERFTGRETLHSVANLSALCGTAAWALNLVLASRAAIVERALGGLERLYAAHRRIGVAVVVLATLHVVFLSLYGSALLAGWEDASGVVALALLIGLVAATVTLDLEYQAFLRLQRWLGAAFLVGALHTFAESGTKADSPVLTVYLAGLTAAGVAGYAYRLAGARRHRYRVARVERLGADAVELVMTPLGRPLEHRAGQFAYLTLCADGVPREAHPFTIASAPGRSELRVVAKRLGDFTARVADVRAGALALVEGPFGDFCLPAEPSSPETWIAGGIGITPFLSWARSLDASRPVDLFYCTPAAEQAHFLDELFAIADRFPAFRVIPVRKATLGRLDVDDLAAVNPRILASEVFICGPQVMLDTLSAGLTARGLPRERIHAENFDFRRA